MTTFHIFSTQIRLYRIKLALEIATLSEIGYEENERVYQLGLLGSLIENLSTKEYLDEQKFRMIVEGLIFTFRGEIYDVENLSLEDVEYMPSMCGCDDDIILTNTNGCCIENFYFSNGQYVIVLADGTTFSVQAATELYRIDGGKPNPNLYHPSVRGVLPN